MSISGNHTSYNTSDWGSVISAMSGHLTQVTKGTPFEKPTNLFWCYHNNAQCAYSVGRYLTYDAPKSAVESIGEGISWVANKLLSYADPATQEFTEKNLQFVAEQANALANNATLWAAPNATQVLKNASIIAQANHTDLPEPFSVVNLIGPAILMGLCANTALKFGKRTLFNLYLFASGKKLVVTTHKINPYHWNMEGEKNAYFIGTVPYGKLPLLEYICIEGGVFTTLAAVGAYLSYKGIEQALINGGSDTERARMITNAILTAITSAPTLYRGIKASLESTPTPAGPKNAPHLVYSDGGPGDSDEATEEEVNLDMNNLMNLLSQNGDLQIQLPSYGDDSDRKPDGLGLTTSSMLNIFGN